MLPTNKDESEGLRAYLKSAEDECAHSGIFEFPCKGSYDELVEELSEISTHTQPSIYFLNSWPLHSDRNTLTFPYFFSPSLMSYYLVVSAMAT